MEWGGNKNQIPFTYTVFMLFFGNSGGFFSINNRVSLVHTTTKKEIDDRRKREKNNIFVPMLYSLKIWEKS